jgi:hypothetical protein
MRGKHNNGNVLSGLAGFKARAQVAAELIAYPMIEQDEIWGQLFDLIDSKRLWRMNYGNIQLFGNYAEDEGCILVIFNDQQFLFHCAGRVNQCLTLGQCKARLKMQREGNKIKLEVKNKN